MKFTPCRNDIDDERILDVTFVADHDGKAVAVDVEIVIPHIHECLNIELTGNEAIALGTFLINMGKHCTRMNPQ